MREGAEVKETVIGLIDEKRLMLYGHIRRMENHRLTRQALGWGPVGRRAGGRQQME
jgi:hypothetical protein